MSSQYFPGQHSDEKILYVVKPHKLVLYLKIGVSLLIATIILILGLSLSFLDPRISLLSLLIALIVGVLGSWVSSVQYRGAVAYVTDRRLVRFETPHPFHKATRTLSWDDTMKVKTFPPNFIWSMLNIGTVILHARSSVIGYSRDDIQLEVAGDDLDLRDVWYYRDLGNYIDKIIYTNKKTPDELKHFRPFVPKPKGQRY